jgi:site-specific DNA recombinase
MKNLNGNTLDKAVCEEIKKLTADNSRFLEELSNIKKELTLKTEDYENELSKISQALSNVEKEISILVQALSSAQNTPAQKYITEKINSLDAEKTQLLQKKDELENLLNNQGLSQIEFDNVKKLALSFGRTFDTMDVDQKRKALRTLVDKIVWDGENVHLYLFGATDDKLPARVIDFLEPQCEDSK